MSKNTVWKVTIERISMDRGCGDDHCMCMDHRSTTTWTHYVQALSLVDRAGHAYAVQSDSLCFVMPERGTDSAHTEVKGQ